LVLSNNHTQKKQKQNKKKTRKRFCNLYLHGGKSYGHFGEKRHIYDKTMDLFR